MWCEAKRAWATMFSFGLSPSFWKMLLEYFENNFWMSFKTIKKPPLTLHSFIPFSFRVCIIIWSFFCRLEQFIALYTFSFQVTCHLWEANAITSAKGQNINQRYQKAQTPQNKNTHVHSLLQSQPFKMLTIKQNPQYLHTVLMKYIW